MARVGKVQPCIFCGEVPCACDGQPKAKTAPRKAAPKSKSADISPPVAYITEPVKSDPFEMTETVSRFRNIEEKESFSEDEWIMGEAIRNLAAAGLMRDFDLHQYKDILNPPIRAEVERRLFEWRARNGKS